LVSVSVSALTDAFAGNDKNHLRAVSLRLLQEVQQCSVRLCLCQAVQIEAIADRLAAARHAALQTAAERYRWRACFLQRRFARHRRFQGGGRRFFRDGRGGAVSTASSAAALASGRALSGFIERVTPVHSASSSPLKRRRRLMAMGS
jgi:hypothetical protein